MWEKTQMSWDLVMNMKEITDRLEFIKIKCSCPVKDTVNGWSWSSRVKHLPSTHVKSENWSPVPQFKKKKQNPTKRHSELSVVVFRYCLSISEAKSRGSCLNASLGYMATKWVLG